METAAKGYRKGLNAVSTNRGGQPTHCWLKDCMGSHKFRKNNTCIFQTRETHSKLIFGLFYFAFCCQYSAVRRCCLVPAPGALHRRPKTLKEIQDLPKLKIFANALSAQTLSVWQFLSRKAGGQWKLVLN